MVGTTLSHYKVLEKIGQGGMGEVYRAQDTTLDRKVALKFLPEEMQQDSTARKRFLREAKSAAALDHPFICHIHEVGEVEGKSFIAMEYIQGTTLKERLVEGPLPVKEALEKATEIAEALEAAHKQKIVHRDLKPSNIMLTPQGHVKVMDFGLAKRVTPVEGEEQEITTALTKQGSTVGTVPYMSPEQVRGQEVDTRSDIFSFGVVLYETLTGVNPFAKGSVMDTAHAILGETPPPLTRYTEDIPVLLQHTVRKMLAKEPDRRYQLIHDVGTDLGELLEESGDSIREVAARPSGASSAAGWWRRAIPWSVAAVAVIVAGVAIWILTRPTPEPLTRFVISTPSTAPLASFLENDLAISPDGERIVYLAATAGRTQLYVRPLDELIATPIAGTEGATGNPFFSPDGESVAFFTNDRKLKKVSLMGGTPITLLDTTQAGWSGSWAEDTIVFSQGPATSGRWDLYQVSPNGGEPESLAIPDVERGERQYASPEILPGGKAVLFSIWLGGTSFQTAVLSLETGERKVLLEEGTDSHYAPTGHLVYELSGIGTLMAVPFDLGRLEITGDSVPILQGVRQAALGWADYSFSGNGTLVYVPGGSEEGLSRLVWVVRQGAVEPLGAPPHVYRHPRLSPDGEQIAVSIQEDSTDIWVYDIARQTLTRLSFEGANQQPLWTPDGKRVTFRSNRAGPDNLFWKPADGSGEAERLTTSEFRQNPGSWSPDGQFLAFHQQPGVESSSSTGRDIWILPMEGERKPWPFLQTPFSEADPKFSPDGRWLAYVSDESGRREVYVQPFPGPGGKWQISTEGGTEAVWAGNGELFYRNENGDKMMVVDITTEPTFRAGNPRLLFEGFYQGGIGGNRAFYDVTPDGQRFLMVKAGEQETEAMQINVVLNWFEELKRLVPTDN